VRRSARCRRGGAIDPVPLSTAGRTVMTFPVICGISSALMEFQFGLSAEIISRDVAHVIPRLRVSVSPLVWFWQGVLRYTDLATQVRQACGMADGWQRVDRVSYAKCGPGDNAPDLRRRQIADSARLSILVLGPGLARRSANSVLCSLPVGPVRGASDAVVPNPASVSSTALGLDDFVWSRPGYNGSAR
jgi:hypothetical protein